MGVDKGSLGRRLPVFQYDANGVLCGFYKDMVEASNTLLIPTYGIRKVLKGQKSQYHGYFWRHHYYDTLDGVLSSGLCPTEAEREKMICMPEGFKLDDVSEYMLRGYGAVGSKVRMSLTSEDLFRVSDVVTLLRRGVVRVYSDAGSHIGTYGSVFEASIASGVSVSRIMSNLESRGRESVLGFVFLDDRSLMECIRITPSEAIPSNPTASKPTGGTSTPSIDFKQYNGPVISYDPLTGKELKSYGSVREIAEEVKKDMCYVRDALNGSVRNTLDGRAFICDVAGVSQHTVLSRIMDRAWRSKLKLRSAECWVVEKKGTSIHEEFRTMEAMFFYTKVEPTHFYYMSSTVDSFTLGGFQFNKILIFK